MKKNSGFTLVELIVVIAILGILAGIAIPVYSGYIDKAQQAADMTQLDSLKTAAIFSAVDSNVNAKVTKITVTIASKKVTAVNLTGTNLTTEATPATSLDATAAVQKLMGGTLPDMKYLTTAEWTETDGWQVS